MSIKGFLAILLAAAFLFNLAEAETHTVSLERIDPFDESDERISQTFEVLPGHPLPVKKVRFAFDERVIAFDIETQPIDSMELFFDPFDIELFGGKTTGGELDSLTYIDNRMLSGHPAAGIAGLLYIDGTTLVDVWVCPFIIDSLSGRNWYISDFKLKLERRSGISLGGQIKSRDDVMKHALLDGVDIIDDPEPGFSAGNVSSAASNVFEGYVVITSENLVESFMPLVCWKSQLGYIATIITVEEIYSTYTGVDEQEQIRNYLADAYASGLRWVLLGGDETIIPIRYAYHLDRTEDIGIEMQQICDLYYADLDGNWDFDGDGLFGEPTQDSADKVPELMLGRVPVSTPEEAANFVTKSILYEKDPGGGDSDFALSVLTSASDQMRDYNDVGQDAIIADSLPDHLVIDTGTLAEAPTGWHEAPDSPAASDFVTRLSEGSNLLYIFAHGQSDAFVSRSSAYNEWPKSYVFSKETAPAGHSTISDLSNHNRFGIVYSVGCNNGAFDMDSPPFENSHPCVAEKFLTDSLAGAAAFIGYSRWGWVASSWRLTADFNHYLFSFDNRLAPSNNFSKANNYSRTDLVYGLNVYGDPSLRVWIDTPHELSVALSGPVDFGENSVVLTATSGGNPIESALVTLVSGNSPLVVSETGPDGKVSLDFYLYPDSSLILTVSKPGYLPDEQQLSPCIALDADDDDDGIRPGKYKLNQNFPNPFNPATSIGFSLPRRSHTRIEIYNLLGQIVDIPVDQYLPPGNHEVVVDAGFWPSGVYFYRIIAAEFTEVKKMILLK